MSSIIARYYIKSIDAQDRIHSVSSHIATLVRDGEAQVKRTRIAFGYNANLDGVTRATEILTTFVDEARSETSDGKLAAFDHAAISSARQLVECFLYFFSRGAAGERYVEAELFARIVDVVRTAPHTQLSPGGNAALMANRVALLGGKALLGGPVGAQLRPLLHNGVEVVEASRVDGEMRSISCSCIVNFDCNIVQMNII